MFYVTATDSFLSGWGMAEGKVNRLIIVCESYEEANTVYGNLKKRSDMKNVRVASNKPYYDSNRYYAQTKTKKDVPMWFQEEKS